MVYFCNQNQITCVKLNRKERTVIFKLEDFKERLHNYRLNLGAQPSSEVRLSFGQTSNYINNSFSTYISVFITSARAEEMLSKVSNKHLFYLIRRGRAQITPLNIWLGGGAFTQRWSNTIQRSAIIESWSRYQCHREVANTGRTMSSMSVQFTPLPFLGECPNH